MKTSNEVNEIQAALSEFKGLMPPVKRKKNVSMKGVNKSGNEYKVDYEYAPLEAIQEQARPHLNKTGLCVVQMLGRNEDGPCIFTRVGHKSGQFIESDWNINLDGIQKEQDRGAKLTFNKRYAYTSALDIILEDEDSDAVDVPLENSRPQQSNVVTDIVPPEDMAALAHYVVTKGNKNVKNKALKDINLKDLLGWLDYFENAPSLKDKQEKLNVQTWVKKLQEEQ